MSPNSKEDISVETEDGKQLEKLVAPQAAPRKYDVIYFNLLKFGLAHVAALYGLYLCFTSAKIATVIFAIFLCNAAMLGITAGAHRLWSHRSYKARLPLQILLMIMNTIAFQNTATDWVRNHRMHHKYCDTDADPHNAARGFFFSHVGWLLVRKHSQLKERGKHLDMADIHSNAVLRFQKNYAIPWVALVGFVIPAYIPVYFWGETLNNSWHIAVMLRYVASLNITFLVNSAAHLWGYKPYDKNMLPAQNLSVAILALGEGFHNYHHVFPWDYKTAELGNNPLNMTTRFIDFFAWLGWAYDLKSVSEETVEIRKKRTGDGTNLWGWDDKDMPKEVKEATEILHPKVA